MQTRFLLDHSPAQDGRHRVRLLVSLTGTPPADGTRAPLNIALVLDRSGSMAGAKLDAARHAAAQLVRRLWPDDIVSVVAYDDEVATVAEPASGGVQSDLAARIAGIHPGGTTNLSGGWLRGRELVARSAVDGRLCRVLLLTDGLANVGIVDPDVLAGLCASARQHGITTTTIGFGTDYDEHLLRRMADAGGGATCYIEHADQAATIFAGELSDLLDTTAQNVSVTVEPAAGVELIAVHHAYPQTRDGARWRFDIGDLYAREPRALFAEFFVAAAPVGETAAVATITVRADIIDGQQVQSETISVPVTVDAHGAARIDPEIEREALILAAANARSAALDAHRRGAYGAAVAALRGAAARIAASDALDAHLEEELHDLQQAAHSLAMPTLAAADEKYVHQRAYDGARGRARKSELISRLRRDT